MSIVDTAIRRMANHVEENPTHGYNCACKDTYIRIVKRHMARLNESQKTEARYLLRQVLKVL